mmetsp:Transcript_4648/g.10169  ORF Transcript_4648/g.10169 Transcript_4648/m.10169 type:complete len:136 (+) Transcript_4648:64-471(+)
MGGGETYAQVAHLPEDHHEPIETAEAVNPDSFESHEELNTRTCSCGCQCCGSQSSWSCNENKKNRCGSSCSGAWIVGLGLAALFCGWPAVIGLGIAAAVTRRGCSIDKSCSQTQTRMGRRVNHSVLKYRTTRTTL